MADYNLGTAHGRIQIDADTGGVNQAEQALGGLDKKAQSAEQALNKTGNVAGVAGLAIAGGLGLATKTAMDFEAGLSAIKAVSGSTASEMETIRAKALQIGADTAFGASEAASAMEELAKAGVSVDDILNGAADATVALAAAGGVDLPTAATLASDSMNMFGLSAKDMVAVADTMAQTANASSIGVGDLGMAMSQAGAVANLVGLSLEETANAIGQLGDEGIKGSDAGTSLKTMLMNLQPTTKAQTNAMMDLGLMTEDGTNAFYNANGELKSLSDVQDLLHNSTKDLTDAEKQMALETIFGSDAIRAAAVMAENGAAGFDAFAKKQEATGSAAEQAKIRQDNLKGSIEQLKGAAETAAITVGSALTPMIRGLADVLGVVVGWFNELSPTQQAWIVGILAGVSGLLLMTAGILKTIMMFRSMIQTMQTLRLLSTATQTGFIKMAGQYILSTLKMIGQGVIWVAKMLAQAAVVVAKWLWMGVQAGLHAAKVAAVWAANAAKTVASWALMSAKAALHAAKVGAAWVVANGAAAAKALLSLGIAVATTIGGWLVMGISAMAGAVVMAAAWFIALGPIGWAIIALIALVAFIIIFWDDIKAAFQKAGAWIAEKLQWLWDKVVEIWNGIITWFKEIPGKIGAVFSGAASWLVEKGSAILTGLKNGAVNMWNTVIGWIKGLPGKVVSGIGDLGSSLLGAGGDLIRGLWNGISNVKNWLLGKIKGFVGNVLSGIKDFFGIGSPSKLMADEVGKWIPPGIAVGIKANADEALKAAAALAEGVVSTVSMSGGGSDAFWDSGALGVGNVPASPEVASYAASQAAAAGKVTNINTHVYNPVAEKASDSEARRLRTLSSLGAF